LLGVAVPLADLTEQVIALGEHLVVVGERAHVAGIDLGDRHVEVTAAPLGRAGDQLDVLRREHDDVGLSDEVDRPLRDAVHANALARRGARGPGPLRARPGLQLDDDLDAGGPGDPLQARRDAGEGVLLAGDLPVDELPVAARAEGLRRRQEEHRLEEVALALRVVSGQDCHAGREGQLEADIIAKIGQREMGQVHITGPSSPQNTNKEPNSAPSFRFAPTTGGLGRNVDYDELRVFRLLRHWLS
jgi:hypothetical protein